MRKKFFSNQTLLVKWKQSLFHSIRKNPKFVIVHEFYTDGDYNIENFKIDMRSWHDSEKIHKITKSYKQSGKLLKFKRDNRILYLPKDLIRHKREKYIFDSEESYLSWREKILKYCNICKRVEIGLKFKCYSYYS